MTQALLQIYCWVQQWKNFLKSANISQSYELIASGTFFIAHGVVTKIYFAVTGVAGEASSKAKVSKAKAEKKSTKDDKPSEKAKPTKEVISRRHIELCVWKFIKLSGLICD